MKEYEVKKLKVGDTYSAQGITRTIIHRDGEWCIGRGSDTDWEVFRVKVAKTSMIWPNGNVTPEGTESVPPISSWGIYGFTKMDRESAFTLLEEIKSRRG